MFKTFTVRRRAELGFALTMPTLLLGPGLAHGGQAQPLTSATKSIQLIAVKRASIGITLSGVAPVVFDLNGAVSAGSSRPQWSVNWNLPGTAQRVRTCISLAGPLTGSGSGTHDIPVGRIEARNESGGRFRSLSGAGCGRSDTFEVSSIYVNGQNNKYGSSKESVVLRIDERGLALPPDNYQGTLNVWVEVIEAPHPIQPLER